MPIAALYDIHGNLPALEAVLADARAANVDRLIMGGDVVPGPMARECLDALRTLDIPTDFIRGNGEADVLTAAAGGEPVRVPEANRATRSGGRRSGSCRTTGTSWRRGPRRSRWRRKASSS